jgi:hypothetical protein
MPHLLAKCNRMISVIKEFYICISGASRSFQLWDSKYCHWGGNLFAGPCCWTFPILLEHISAICLVSSSTIMPDVLVESYQRKEMEVQYKIWNIQQQVLKLWMQSVSKFSQLSDSHLLVAKITLSSSCLECDCAQHPVPGCDFLCILEVLCSRWPIPCSPPNSNTLMHGCKHTFCILAHGWLGWSMSVVHDEWPHSDCWARRRQIYCWRTQRNNTYSEYTISWLVPQRTFFSRWRQPLMWSLELATLQQQYK